jgi:hypothetical protein
MFLFACFSKLHDSENISNSCVSLNDDEIFLCLVNERFISTFFYIICIKILIEGSDFGYI